MKKVRMMMVPLVFFVLLTLCVGCGDDTAAVEDSSAAGSAVQEMETALTGVGEVSGDVASVSTPYCRLYYPIEYAERITADIAEDEDSCTVAFSGRTEIGDVFLFQIYFGGEKGEQLGTLTTESGETIPVSYQQFEIDLDDRWEEEDTEMLLEEQSAVSDYVLEKLSEESGYKAAE